MNRCQLWTLSLALVAAGCTCGAFDPDTTRFTCSTNDDCGPGFVCAQAEGGLECVPAGGDGGGGSGGGGGGGSVGGGGGTGGGANDCPDAAACVDPPDRVEITTAITTMLRYECRGPFLVDLRNANGVRTAIRDTAVALSVALPGVTVHSVASCSDAALTTFTLLADQSSFVVYLKADGQAFGTATLTAAAAQVATAGTAKVEVQPQPIDHLAFTSPPRTLSAAQCSTDEVTLEFRDVMNRRTDVAAPTTITFSSVPGDLGNANIFFSDAACATDGATRQLQPGQGAVVMHVLARRAGSFVLRAMPSAGQEVSQPLTVVPAAASKLVFTNAPVVLNTTQSCSTGLFTVQLRDPFDNDVITAADVPIRVSVATLVNVTLYDATGTCTAAARTDFTIAAGSGSVSFRARGTTSPPRMGTIQASALSGGALSDASQALSISSGIATRFVVTGTAQSPLASQCSSSPVTLELQDSVGNAAASLSPVAFTLTAVPASTDPSFRFYSGAGCLTDLGGMLTVPAGQSSGAFYFRGNRPVASFEIRATSVLTPPPTFLPGNSIRAAAPGKLVFGAPLSRTAQVGACTSPYTVNVLDLFDNPTSFSTPQTMVVNSNPSGVTVGGSTCSVGNSVSLAAGATQATFSAQHVVPATYALTATIGGLTTAAPASLTVTAGPPMLMRDTPVGTASLLAGGCQQITLTRRDAFGNNVPTVGVTPVMLSSPAGTSWAVYSNTSCMGTGGASITMNSTHTVTFSVSPRTAGSYQLSASVAGQTVLIDFQVTAGAPARLAFTSPVQSIPAVSCSAATIVTLQDVWGNTAINASDRSVSFSATPATANPLFYANAACSAPLGGTNQASLPAATSAVTVYFRILNPGPIVLNADSALLISATQAATIQ